MTFVRMSSHQEHVSSVSVSANIPKNFENPLEKDFLNHSGLLPPPLLYSDLNTVSCTNTLTNNINNSIINNNPINYSVYSETKSNKNDIHYVGHNQNNENSSENPNYGYICCVCRQQINDQWIYKVGSESYFHHQCLTCSICNTPFDSKCYFRNNGLYCKDHFYQKYGKRCQTCGISIEVGERIRKASDHFVFHVDCFNCFVCKTALQTGDLFYLLTNGEIICKSDYLNYSKVATDSRGDIDGSNKRPRTTITAKQLETLKSAYSSSSKPARHVREQLSLNTGLDMRVVQVWFQNRRAKEKRLRKDAGRLRWTHPHHSHHHHHAFQGASGSVGCLGTPNHLTASHTPFNARSAIINKNVGTMGSSHYSTKTPQGLGSSGELSSIPSISGLYDNDHFVYDDLSSSKMSLSLTSLTSDSTSSDSMDTSPVHYMEEKSNKFDLGSATNNMEGNGGDHIDSLMQKHNDALDDLDSSDNYVIFSK